MPDYLLCFWHHLEKFKLGMVVFSERMAGPKQIFYAAKCATTVC